MAQSQFDQFLKEATYTDPESGLTLDGDALYGPYTSWCYISHNTPQPERIFWEAMRQRSCPYPKLRMKGPAAADYIMSSYPAMV
ncbi:hypothetical protein [Arthrobacter sp. ZGTC412]|uniref:hypothetical protein n=1 Tax=Arthrobacter sp. ZGTC412 TaxID=2058900 RepID=UPI000CE4CFD5|nr:hypothetical protein [Arthrobacter sp. ZGTC412]